MGIYVLVFWVYSWIENMIEFNIANISIWFAVGICVSSEFRKMTNYEFKEWIRSLFISKEALVRYNLNFIKKKYEINDLNTVKIEKID